MGAAVLTLAAVALLACRRMFVPGLVVAPFVAVLLAAVAAITSIWLVAGFELSAARSAGLVATVFLAVTIFAPKIVLRAAHMRGPQLPRDAEDLQFDVEPAPAAQVRDRTVTADRYLSAGMVAASAVFVATFPFLLAAGNWSGPVLVFLLAGAVLLRARTFLSAWQRVPLTMAGTSGLALTVLAVAADLSPQWRGALLLCLLGLLYPLVMAAPAAGAAPAADLGPPGQHSRTRPPRSPCSRSCCSCSVSTPGPAGWVGERVQTQTDHVHAHQFLMGRPARRSCPATRRAPRCPRSGRRPGCSSGWCSRS